MHTPDSRRAAVLRRACGGPPRRSAPRPRQTGTLRVVVRDPSGAVIPNAVGGRQGHRAGDQDVVVAGA